MDLGAYAQIENLSSIAEKNGIFVPRLRGYRLMSEENPISDEEIKEAIRYQTAYLFESLCEGYSYHGVEAFGWQPWSWQKNKKRKYLVYENDEDGRKHCVDARWDRLHGKNRKAFKYAIKKAKEDVMAQYSLWNKYAGKENILYVHARIGAINWESYYDQVVYNPRFLEKSEDYFDHTYCDLYFSIDNAESLDGVADV